MPSARIWFIGRICHFYRQILRVEPDRRLPIQITLEEKTQDVVITDIISGKMLPAVSVHWFAWQAFYPDSSVWRPIN